MTLPSKPGIPKIAIWGSLLIAALAALFLATSLYWDPARARTIFQIILLFIVVLAACLMTVWLARALVLMVAGRRASRAETAATDTHPAVSASEQAELDALAGQVDEAVRLLRESRLGSGTTSAEALYSLPWILMLGPRGSGKTTLLKECGMEFPYTSADRRRRGEGEAGCEFWFSRKSVVLDLSGRIAFDQEHRAAFRGFLQQLKKVRKVRPLDGAVAAIRLTDIIGRNREETAALAKSVRQRCDTMLRELGARLPVYLVFTHCDELEGFRAYFGNLRRRDRDQVWGATISSSQRKHLPADQIFRKEFDLLVESLRDHRLPLLAGEKDSYKLAQIYTFPARMANVRERLAEFVETLFQLTPYTERPIFRGFYMTSAAEKAPPEKRGQEEPLRWDPARHAVAAKQAEEPSNSYFLEQLFSQVIFADRQLATESVDVRVKRRGWMDVAAVTSIVACTVVLMGMIVSFVKNQQLISSTRETARLVSRTVSNAADPEFLGNLDALRRKVEYLEALEKKWGTWFAYGWGLSHIDAIRQACGDLCYRKMDEIFYRPALAKLIQRMRSSVSSTGAPLNYDQLHRYLQAYLMLTYNQDHFDEDFVGATLAELWNEGAPASVPYALASLRFCAREVIRNTRSLAAPAGEKALIGSVQYKLASNDYSDLDRKYSSMISAGNASLSSMFTLEQATHGKSNFLASKYEVPGVFTLQGWTNYFQGAVADVGKGVSKDDWVLGRFAAKSSSTASVADFQQQILRKYFEEYSQHWQRFLEGVSVSRFESYSDAKGALYEFTQQDSGFRNLLLSIAENTKIPPVGTGKINQGMANAAAGAGLIPSRVPALPQDELAQRFGPLHDLVLPVGKQPARIDSYFQGLDNVRLKMNDLAGTPPWDRMRDFVAKVITDPSGNEFRDAGNTSQQIKQSCSNTWTTPVGILLDQPLQNAWRVVLEATSRQLEARWRAQVKGGFDREVAPVYPFRQDASTGAELPLQTFVNYFKPHEGVISGFKEKDIDPLMPPREAQPGTPSLFPPLERSSALDEFLSKVKEIQDMFFPVGSEAKVQFEVRTPDGVIGIESCLLEIGGDHLIYENGKQDLKTFSWPAPRARLQIRPIGGAPQELSFAGDWALFKLIQKASSISPPSAGIITVTWNLPSIASRISYTFRLIRTQKNPFMRELFSDLGCPERIAQVPAAER